MTFENYSVCLMTDHGTLKVLEGFTTYQQADNQLDKWVDKYSDGLVDIFSRGVLVNCEVELWQTYVSSLRAATAGWEPTQ